VIDYRDLLARYMDFVGQEEGVTFVSRLRRPGRRGPAFTEEEVLELEAINAELPRL
jgi:hypothetical protein